MRVCPLICVPASRRRARGLRPASRVESRPCGLIPDVSGPQGLRAALALQGTG